MVPVPNALHGLVCAIIINDMNRTDFVKATELARASRASLEPDYQGYIMVLPTKVISLPEGIVNGCGLILIVPVDVLISGKRVAAHGSAQLLVEEGSRIFKA